MRIHALAGILLLAALASAPALAGPPIICHPVKIGSATSLPWRDLGAWNGTDDSYDVSRLVADTLALLTPQMPTPVRMETLRRAAIYSFKDTRIGDELSARLLARTLDDEAAGRQSPTDWFDAGYFVEALRELGEVYHFQTADRNLDGAAWIRKAIALGGKDMQQAATIVEHDAR